MRRVVRVTVRALAVVALLALPGLAWAQEAIIGGTITDSTSGVLPGVAVQVVNEATGAQVETFTDERGAFRIPVRIGRYRITAELAGFTTVTRAGVTVVVGQQAVINLQLAPSALQETVTVTGEAPLLDVSSSALGGNIDSRQMQELPVNGRNFLDLTLLAPGARANSTDAGGVPTTTGLGTVQLNIDGMQVTNNCCGGSNRQPSFGRDSIAEFQFISNRFDATQGRSSGAQVNVITKSGTNTQSGSFSGYFRDDSMNAEDFIQKRVVPYANQQYSVTTGGPILRDKLHYFFSYEYEREPSTVTHNTPYPSYNIDLTATRSQHKPSARVDSQLTNNMRLSLSGYIWRDYVPIDGTQGTIGGATNHPANAIKFDKFAEAASATLTNVIGSSVFNEVKVGWAANHWDMQPINPYSSSVLAGARSPQANALQISPVYTFTSFNVGGGTNFPQLIGQDLYTFRDDLSFSANLAGRHDFRVGGEYLNYLTWHDWCNVLRGNARVDRGPVPANIEALFPVDVNQWNPAGLPSSLSRDYRTAFGNCVIHSPRDIFGTWLQDDWQVSQRLTLNLGVRYDVETDTFANELAVAESATRNFLEPDRPIDTNNIVPRVGFAYSLNDRTVLRGGGGIYYAWLINQTAHPVRFANVQRVASIAYDGRADFITNPWNGPLPALGSLEQAFCNVNPVAGCVPRTLGQTIVPPDAQNPYSYQASFGVQRQLRQDMSVTVDYSYTGVRHDRVTNYNVNLAFDPATGLNYPSTDTTRIPYPNWGPVLMDRFDGNNNYNGLEMGFTKRMSNNWQASATYTVSQFSDGSPDPWSGVLGVVDQRGNVGGPVPFSVPAPIGEEYGLAVTDQRHRAVFNGIWQMPYGFQLSGLYFFGSGQRYVSTWGGDALRTGGANGGDRAIPANRGGGFVARNDVTGDPLHRVDLRLLKRFPLIGSAGIDGMFEVFNLFNHENYGSYTTLASNANYRNPSFNANVAYQPRILQVGFRLTF